MTDKRRLVILALKETEAKELADYIQSSEISTIKKIYNRIEKALNKFKPESLKATKCQMEGCGADTTSDLFITDKETLKEINVCLECWNRLK